VKIGQGNTVETPSARIFDLTIDISFDTMLKRE
jgi:hypothetical protein